jgi:hypothetical protein
LELGVAQVRALELGAAKVPVLELGAPKIRALELGSNEVRALEFGAAKVHALELAADEVRVLKVGAAEIRELELGVAEERVLELGAGEVGSTEVRTPQVERWVIFHYGPPPKHRQGGLHIWRAVSHVGDLPGLDGLRISGSVLPDVGSEYLEHLKAGCLGVFGDALQSVDAA